MSNEKIRISKGNRLERVTKNQATNEPDKKRAVQSGNVPPMSNEDLVKFVKHDLRAALYVLEVILSQDKLLQVVIDKIKDDQKTQTKPVE